MYIFTKRIEQLQLVPVCVHTGHFEGNTCHHRVREGFYFHTGPESLPCIRYNHETVEFTNCVQCCVGEARLVEIKIDGGTVQYFGLTRKILLLGDPEFYKSFTFSTAARGEIDVLEGELDDTATIYDKVERVAAYAGINRSRIQCSRECITNDHLPHCISSGISELD